MKTLAKTSYFVFRPSNSNYNSKYRLLSFVAHQNHFTCNFNLPNISSHSISASALPPLTLTNDEGEIYQTIHTDHQKRVHVRFLLEKECAFGQQFLLVGDDPVIGLWEPSDGVPLVWSDGHLWTAQVDLPIGKVIKYKFVLQEEPGTMSWQLGPDRFFETWDTEKTITVFEDWDDPQLQKIGESDPSEEILINSDFVVVDESPRITNEWTDVNEELDSDTDGSDSILEKAHALFVADDIEFDSDTDGSNSIGEKALPLFVAEDIELDTDGSDSILEKAHALFVADDIEFDSDTDGSNSIGEKAVALFAENIAERELDSGIAENDVIIGKDETRLITDEGVHALVPGLISIAHEEIEEVLEREHDESTTSNVPNLFVSEGGKEHDKSTKTVPNGFVSEDVASVLASEQKKSTTTDVPRVLVSEVEKELEETTTLDVPSVLVSEVEIEHDKSTTSDAPSVLGSKVENEHEKSTTSDAPILFASEVEREHDESTKSNVPNDVEDLDVTEFKEEKRVLDSVLKGDKQWGRQTLQKFLASLGFQSP